MREARVLCSMQLLSALVLVTGCAAGDEAQPQVTVCAPNQPNCGTPPPTTMVPNPITQQPVAGGGSTTVPTGGTQAPPPTSTGNSGGVPCDVAPVVSDACTQCHGSTPQFGAPMPLMTLADFHKPAFSNPQRKVYEVVAERINAPEVGRRMPPASNEALAQADLEAMNAWLNAGALGSVGNACNITADMGMAGSGGSTAPQPTGMGGLSIDPIDYNDPMMECYEVRAHAPGNRSAPYSVPTRPDYYVNFHFMPEFDGTRYVRSYKLLLDNSQVVHHWLFFKNSGPKTDLAIEDSTGTHPDGELQHGWAPGGGDVYFHADVGTEMPSDTSYTLELHYNNTTGGAAPDATGVEICVTPTKPANVATMSWLGTDGISGTTASGTCDPSSNQPIRIVAGTPHMHTKGNHMKVVVNRQGGEAEVVHDLAFDFNYQVVYPEDIMIMPGDTITTTCSYSSPATFGPGTNAEMCYWFAMHYPADSLVNGNVIGSIIHGPNTCLQ
jgi:hypothetical protein